MKHTKIRDYGDGTFGLLVRNENGKYIQIGRAKKLSLIVKENRLEEIALLQMLNYTKEL